MQTLLHNIMKLFLQSRRASDVLASSCRCRNCCEVPGYFHCNRLPAPCASYAGRRAMARRRSCLPLMSSMLTELIERIFVESQTDRRIALVAYTHNGRHDAPYCADRSASRQSRMESAGRLNEAFVTRSRKMFGACKSAVIFFAGSGIRAAATLIGESNEISLVVCSGRRCCADRLFYRRHGIVRA